MQKTDLSKEQKYHYKAKATPELVTIAPANYITLEGNGAPEAPGFKAKVRALYSVAYNIKKISKLQQQDFKVPGLEGLWWTQSGDDIAVRPTEEWYWKLMIQLPEFVTVADFRQAVALAAKKGPQHFEEMLFERLPGALSVQILHVGPYDEEAPSLEKLYAYIKQHQLEISGVHHEIYLNDPSKTAKEKLKTILRLDVRSK